MATVQSNYGSQPPLDPDAIKLTLAFLDDGDVGLIKSVVTGGGSYSEHTILLSTVVLSTQYSGPVVVRRQPAGSGHRTLAALRPDTARKLGHQLCDAADEVEGSQPDNPPHAT